MRQKILAAAKAAFPLSLPIMAGYIILGIGFGLLLESKGYGILWAFGMSLFIYAGSLEYVCIDLMTSGAALISAILISLMVNARHLFYGISMIIRYRNMGKFKPYLIFGLTDECYSVMSHVDVPEGVDRQWFTFLFTLMCHAYWVIGSVAGSAFGTLIPINTDGVEFSMTALFVVIVVDNLMKKSNRLTSAIGIASSVICLIIFGADNFLIPSMILISAVLLLFRGRIEKAQSAGGEG